MKRSKKFLSLILVLVMCLALMPVVVSADDGNPDATSNEHGTPLTIEDERYGVSITFDRYLRTETHTYRMTDYETERELERTFYVVEDNSPILIEALPGREYAPEGHDETDFEELSGYPWHNSEGPCWNDESKSFIPSYWQGRAPGLTGPVQEIATPRENIYLGGDIDSNYGRYGFYLCESDFNRLVPIDQPVTSTPAPTPTAIAATQTVKVDGKDVTFYAYALADGKGGLTNYVKLRDVAAILNGTKGQFAVGWNGAINLETGKPYTMAGGELEQTFVGDQPYVVGSSPVNVNGAPAKLEAITLVDSKGGNYNYFKLRDLGEALGFNVGWSKDKGVFIETDKPYTDAD